MQVFFHQKVSSIVTVPMSVPFSEMNFKKFPISSPHLMLKFGWYRMRCCDIHTAAKKKNTPIPTKSLAFSAYIWLPKKTQRGHNSGHALHEISTEGRVCRISFVNTVSPD